jgi:hypothetical protein
VTPPSMCFPGELLPIHSYIVRSWARLLGHLMKGYHQIWAAQSSLNPTAV